MFLTHMLGVTQIITDLLTSVKCTLYLNWYMNVYNFIFYHIKVSRLSSTLHINTIKSEQNYMFKPIPWQSKSCIIISGLSILPYIDWMYNKHCVDSIIYIIFILIYSLFTNKKKYKEILLRIILFFRWLEPKSAKKFEKFRFSFHLLW